MKITQTQGGDFFCGLTLYSRHHYQCTKCDTLDNNNMLWQGHC